jgi:hypothetical protein
VPGAAGLVASDVGGLGILLAESGTPLVGAARLAGGFALTFASLAMGSAIRMLRKED